MGRLIYPIISLDKLSEVNKELPVWLKYWLLKKTKNHYVPSDYIEGTSLNLTDSGAFAPIDFQILGNTVQDGTPTPDDPVDIVSAGENGTITIDKSNKNLFDGLEYVRKVASGLASNNIEKNNITLSGMSSWGTLSLLYKLPKNKDYILSFKEIDDISHKAGVTIYGTNELMYSSGDLTSLRSNTVQLTANTEEYITSSFNSGNYEYILLRFWNNSTGTALETPTNLRINEIQLEYGTTATTYIAHQGKSYVIPTQSPFRKIGDVQDDFVKQEGVRYERHYIGHIASYDGETIETDYMSTTGELSTGAEVIYVLAEPTLIECTAEQTAILEEITTDRLYQGQTNFTSTDDVPPYLKVKYYEIESVGE